VTTQEYVTAELCGQWIGIPVQDVRDVVKTPAMTPVAGAPSWIRGVINLRGRIVTAIDLRSWLDLPLAATSAGISVIVDYNDEHYTLMMDRAGDVISIDHDQTLTNPPTLGSRWKSLSRGVQPYKSGLLVLLDLEAVLGEALAAAA
jgi:purine-binding chemotaxis protein CheW